MEMRNNNILILSFMFPLLLSFHSINADENSKLNTYIIRVKRPMERKLMFANSKDLIKQWHQSFISTENETLAETRLLYSYKNTINGFAARLTKKEVEVMSTKDGFLSAHADRLLSLQTTHTPTFLGLVQNQPGVAGWKRLGGGDGVIIGSLDSGVFPDHPSFSGVGMPPPPTKWKGRCDFSDSQCNNKIIGAKTFLSGAIAREAPIDKNSHGTHTASTAAGARVENAQVLGNAKGVAVGIAPRAHLAIYKVCASHDCNESDVLAAIDEAIKDGVDVINLSLSVSDSLLPFFDDLLAVSTFKAMAKGIFVSCAAMNDGPDAGTILNFAPWYLTVAASTIDRQFRVNVKLGNGIELPGQILNQPTNFTTGELPLVYAAFNKIVGARFCGNGSLEGFDVVGKVVVCDIGSNSTSHKKAEVVKAAGGVAMILTDYGYMGHNTFANNYSFPILNIDYFNALKIKTYISSTRNPTTRIYFKGTVLGESVLAPTIAHFSSRGPNILSPGILKPDITGPGVDVLAAVPFDINDVSKSEPAFGLMSGTSMSTPHLAGIAALIKSAHPNWSAAAIKSAIMTTAYTTYHSGRPIVDERLLPANHFAIGAGHVDPIKAISPGLVYDLNADDYIPYFCGLNYDNSQVSLITGKHIDCSKVKSIIDSDLNYPSISVLLGPYTNNVTIWRTVKNVGKPVSIYRVKVDAPKGVTVSVEPKKLHFFMVGEEKKYAVTFIGSEEVTFIDREADTGAVDGQLKWISKNYVVRSPITVTLQK